MFKNILKLKNVLHLSFAQAFGIFAFYIQYAIYPVIVMSVYDEKTAGIAVS